MTDRANEIHITTNDKRRLCTSIRAVASRLVMSIIHTLRASTFDRVLVLSARYWANNEQIKINNYDNNNYYMLMCNRVGHICLQH
jgi:hypothetical protein